MIAATTVTLALLKTFAVLAALVGIVVAVFLLANPRPPAAP